MEKLKWQVMSLFDDYSVEDIKNDILSDITEFDTREGSFANTLISPTSYKIWELLQSLNAVIPIAFVDETSGIYIDKRANEFGIERKKGTKAQATMKFTGKIGTVIEKNNIFLTEDGYEYILTESVNIGDNGTCEGKVTAAEAGEIYNTDINTIINQYKTINGLVSVTNTTAAVGGTNDETDKSLVNRLYEYWQLPATSGNVYHYKQWAKEVDGVGDAKIFPLWNGNGTVKVVIASSEMLSCGEEIVNNCRAHIEELRPIGATVTVESVLEKSINISCSCTLNGSVSIDDIKLNIEKKVKEYFKNISFNESTLLYNRIGYIVMDTQGVSDFSNLTINDVTENILIADNEVPVLGALVVNVNGSN